LHKWVLESSRGGIGNSDETPEPGAARALAKAKQIQSKAEAKTRKPTDLADWVTFALPSSKGATWRRREGG